MLVNWLLEHYGKKLHLEVTSDNTKAVKFYKGIGLLVTGEYTSKEGAEFLQFSSPTLLGV